MLLVYSFKLKSAFDAGNLLLIMPVSFVADIAVLLVNKFILQQKRMKN